MPQRRIESTDGQPGALFVLAILPYENGDVVASEELQSHGDDVGCLFTGTKGEKAYVSSLWSDDLPQSPIRVDTETPMSQIRFMESFESRHSNHELARKLVRSPIGRSLFLKCEWAGVGQRPRHPTDSAAFGQPIEIRSVGS